MKASDLIDTRLRGLIKRELHTLVPPLLRLREAIGNLELDDRTETFVAWILGFDHSAIDGLAALARSVAEQIKRSGS